MNYMETSNAKNDGKSAKADKKAQKEEQAEQTITLKIDGKDVTAKKGENLIQASRRAGVNILTLCYHDDLEPYGACRLCMVEIEKHDRKKLVAACCYEVEEGLSVRTKTEEIIKIRKMLTEFLMAVSPSGDHMKLAREYGIKESRFKLDENTESPCTLCGLCVRYCDEITKSNAVTFVGRGIDRKVTLVPVASRICMSCRKCFNFCDAGKIVYLVDNILG